MLMHSYSLSFWSTASPCSLGCLHERAVDKIPTESVDSLPKTSLSPMCSAFYNLKSVPLVSSSFFFSCIHVGTINASLISRKKFTALHALFYISRYLFYCTARVINGQEIKYDFYSSRAQYDCNRFVIILFRKQGLKRSNKIVRDGSS